MGVVTSPEEDTSPEPPSTSAYRGPSRPLYLPRLNLSLDSAIWHFLEQHIYRLRKPPPLRKRTKPMEVICVGLPRSGTESLQRALLHLGYDHTYHGWDIVYDQDIHSPGWVALARKKWLGQDASQASPAAPTITAADFDALLGHSVAVTDAAASCFAAEMIAAYPEAKVVLNMRRDMDAWHASLVRTLVHVNESWSFWVASWLDRECFWAWHVYERFLWPMLFRAPDGEMGKAIRRNARWIAQEHCNMIRGLVPKERLLEWYIDDGWEPLCSFLGKPTPAVEFPHANAATGGWKSREEQCLKRWVQGAFWKLIIGLTTTVLLAVLLVSWTKYEW